MFDNVKLGKLPAKFSARALPIDKYVDLKKALPATPITINWSHAVQNYPMYGNDRCGDCTAAAVGHMIQTWTANTGSVVTISDADVLALYSTVSGYDPNTGANDNGAVETTVLEYWKNNGVVGHKILGYLSLEPGNLDHIQLATSIFGGVYLGIELPLIAQQQINAKQPWSAPLSPRSPQAFPGSWGGHAVPVVNFGPQGLTCVTWGQLQPMTNKFFSTYCDEAYAIVSPDWLNAQGKSPNGFDLATLLSDLAAL